MSCGCGKKRINKISSNTTRVKKQASKDEKKENRRKRMIAIKAMTNSTNSKK